MVVDGARESEINWGIYRGDIWIDEAFDTRSMDMYYCMGGHQHDIDLL